GFTMPPPLASDEELSQRVGAADRNAFRVLYERHSTAVYTLAAHMLGDDQADEAVQEVFLRLWRKSDLFDSTRGSFRTWLLGITRNHALDKLRRLTVERRLTAGDAVEAL